MMNLFLVSQDNNIWSIIEYGNYAPQVDENDHSSVVKAKTSWTSDDKAKVLLNSKARVFLT